LRFLALESFRSYAKIHFQFSLLEIQVIEGKSVEELKDTFNSLFLRFLYKKVLLSSVALPLSILSS